MLLLLPLSLTVAGERERGERGGDRERERENWGKERVNIQN